MNYIAYKKGYKYQLKEMYITSIEIKPLAEINTEYIGLDLEGNLRISKGYAWDGPSGPTIDTLTFMRGSLVHDVLYQLMREKYIDNKEFREPADRILQNICIEDGMWRIRALWIYLAVHFFGNPAADPSKDKPIIKAPKKY